MRYHDNSNADEYRKHISNIAYRFGFIVEEDDEGHIHKINDGERTLLTEGIHPHKRWWQAWRKLYYEYGHSGIWKDRD